MTVMSSTCSAILGYQSDTQMPLCPYCLKARFELDIPADRSVVVFVGSDYSPNLEAARYICGTLAPALTDVRFVIAGGCTNGLAPGEIPANVTALGAVDSETRNLALAAADLAINPMSRGSGTNIKMLDFFAAHPRP